MTIAAPASEEIRNAWEAAYRAFETPEEEIAKFIGRLRRLGMHRWDKTLEVAEVFCGRGNGLVALQRLGFQRLRGIDLSPELAALYTGPAQIDVGDARQLPWPTASLDVAVVQGGLHHLPNLADLRQTAAELARVLRPTGRLVVVEPWLTPFLQFVHAMCDVKMARRCSKKLDALARMIELETPDYQTWLASPTEILNIVSQHFDIQRRRIAWGKIMFVARPRSAAT